MVLICHSERALGKKIVGAWQLGCFLMNLGAPGTSKLELRVNKQVDCEVAQEADED